MVLAAAAAGDQYEYASMCIHIPINYIYTRYIQIYTSQIYYSYTGLFMIYVRICVLIYIVSIVCRLCVLLLFLDVYLMSQKLLKLCFIECRKSTHTPCCLSFNLPHTHTHTHCTATKGGQFECLRSTQN